MNVNDGGGFPRCHGVFMMFGHDRLSTTGGGGLGFRLQEIRSRIAYCLLPIGDVASTFGGGLLCHGVG